MSQQRTETPYRRPLFAAGLSVVAVTALALHGAWWLSLACVALLLLWLFFRRALLCAAVVAIYFVSAMGFRHWYVSPTVHLDGETDTLTAVVVEQPTYGGMYTVQVTHSEVLRQGTRVMLWCTGEETPRMGGTVTATVELFAVEKNQRHSASRGAFVYAFPTGDEDTAVAITEWGASAAADSRLQAVRALTAAPRRYLGDEESGILSALCFGERSFLSDETAAAFQGSGLSHLLVVSGLHLSMVAVAVRLLLRRTGMRLSVGITVLIVWLFAWLTGFSPSILRAAIMCTVWLVGCFFFCRSDGLNSLGLAALLLLAVNPYTLWNVSFQLSFAATLGVLLLAPRLVSRYERVADPDSPWWHVAWRWLRHKMLGGAAVCVSALLFTLPMAAYHYGGFPLTSIVSNVLAVPVAGAILLLGWIGALCGLVPFLGWLSQCVLLVADWLIRYLKWVAALCSPDWAWLTVSTLWGWLLLCGVCALIAFGIYFRIPLRRVTAVVAALVVLTVGVGYPLTVSPVSLTIVPSDNEGGLILRQGSHCALLLTHAEELNEITYEAAPAIPDAIVVGEDSAAAAYQLHRFPTAQVLSVADMPVGTEAELWKDCCLTVHADGWWRLQIKENVLWIATDPTIDVPAPDGTCIYVGGTPAHPPDTAYTVVCSEAWLRRHRPHLTGRETFVIENPMTLIPHRGEWRMSLWL